MKQLLSADFYKAVKQKSYYQTFLAFAILGVALCLNYYFTGIKSDITITNYEFVLASLGNVELNIIIISLFICIFITLDHINNSVKLHIAYGFKRYQFFLSKLIIMIGFTVILILFYYLFLFLIGSLFFGFNTVSIQLFFSVLRILAIELLLYITFSIMIGSICLAIGNFNIAVSIVFLSIVILTQLFQTIAFVSMDKIKLYKNWLLTLMSENLQLIISDQYIQKTFFIMLCYTTISISIGIIIFTKKDIK